MEAARHPEIQEKRQPGAATMASAKTQFRPGDVILDRFRVVRLLGSGGMGEVYEADDLQLGRIAIKTIRGKIASTARALEWFRREIQLARRVSGPEVCRIHELFIVPATERDRQSAFLTMELLDGIPLSTRLRQSGAIPPAEALPLVLDICRGLDLIHREGIVHRDLKCSNIMLCRRDGALHAVLMDFGLAAEDSTVEGQAMDPTLSDALAERPRSGIAGTPAYMAPEQFEGKSVSAATDIYALGVVLYELLTGKQPFAAETPIGAAIRRAHKPEPINLYQHGVPHHWNRVIERCLEYHPERRFRTAGEVSAALKASQLQPKNFAKDRPVIFFALLVVLCALLGSGLLAWWHARQYYRPDSEAERWYRAGIDALHEASYLKATRSLEKATEHDSRFAMAHARLAEAWSNLDFDGAAEREMLLASAGQNRLAPLDHMYLDAIRATLTRDFRSALELYKQIPDRLPRNEKSSGYVDLGMAYERAGDPRAALDQYLKSSSLNPENPACWLRAGMVETKMNRLSEAGRAFGHVESIYTEEMNPEGTAELNYQRGYLASLAGQVSDAEKYLLRSLDEAQRISSYQLQIRALTQLSSIENAAGDPGAAVAHASEAVRLAHDHQQDAWAAMALARLANARMMQGSAHYGDADSAVSEARSLAVQTQQGRALALANIVLASLRDAEQRPNDVVQPASEALTWYRQNGYFEPAANATLLLLRAEASSGEVGDLLKNSQSFLTLAQMSGNPWLLFQAENSLGNAYNVAEQYPDAVLHYQKAESLAGTDINRSYEAAAAATVLSALGRFSEAKIELAGPVAKHLAPIDVASAEVQLQLAQARYRAALERCDAVLRSHPELLPEEEQAFRHMRAVAEAHVGQTRQAVLEFAKAGAAGNSSGAITRVALLQQAEIQWLAGQSNATQHTAADLLQQFRSRGQLDSALRAALLAAVASHSIRDDTGRHQFVGEAVDILTSLQHNWSPHAVQTYLSRPDIRSLMRAAALPESALSK